MLAIMASVSEVLTLGIEAVTAALERAELTAPAYAAGLWGSGEDDLAPAVICVGLEPDRAIATSRREVWNVSDYAVELRVVPDLRDDETFLAAEAQALEELYDSDIDDPQQWVLNRIAKAVGERRPLAPVTDDYVVFAFHDDFGAELRANLRFSGGAAASLLEQRGLMP
jgi:hypothetical protein